MGDCQILALTKFNLQAVLCPLFTCLLFKTLMKRFIGLVYPSPIWNESLLCSMRLPLCCPLQSRVMAPTTLSVLKQIKSHWQTLSALSSPLCFALGLLQPWQNCFDMCMDSQPVFLTLPTFLTSSAVHCDSCNGKAIATLLWYPGTCGWMLSCLKAAVTTKSPNGSVTEEEMLPPTRLWMSGSFFPHPSSRPGITAFQRCHSPFPCLLKVPRRMWPGAVQYYLNLLAI